MRSLFCDSMIGLRLAIKARFIYMVCGVQLVVVFAFLLSAYFGGRQPVTVALDVGISTIRLLLPLLLVLLIQELLSREFDRRCYLSSLTYPRARYSFLLGRFAAVLAIVLGGMLASGGVLVGLVPLISSAYFQATPVALGQPFVIVLSFIGLDLAVLAAVATLLAVVASTPSFVLIGTLGFMLVARSYGAIIELLTQQAGLVGNAENYRTGLGVLGYFFPDLGALDVRMLALYGRQEFLPSDWLWLLLGNLAYVIVLLALAVWFLQRKRFV